MKLAAVLGTMGLIAALTLPGVADDARIVFIAGNRSHGSGEHEFRAGSLLLAKALNEQSGLPVRAEVLGVDWAKQPAQLDGAAAVVIYADASSGVAGQWDYLDGLAKQGVGLMFMHYAVHPSKEMADKYQRRWVGATMEDDYSVNPHWLAELKAMASHPIARGVPESFECYDEFYYHMRFLEDREKVIDLATAVPSRERMKRYINMWNKNGADGMGKEQTLMWGIERPDGGRGVGFTGGHYHQSWAVDGFRTLVLNAVVWTAGMEVPEGGVVSRSPSEDELNANLDDYGDRTAPLKLPVLDDWRKMPPAKVPVQREK